jgi:alcohol dehydrogenase
MRALDFQLTTRIVFGEGALARLGELAQELSFTRTLIVADRGIVATGEVGRAAEILRAAGIEAFVFSDFDSNPDTRMVEAGRVLAVALTDLPYTFLIHFYGRHSCYAL